jgi:hypothetical protein
MDYNSQCHMYEIPSSDGTNTYSIGDAVKSLAAGGADASNPWGTFGIAQVVKCTGATTELARGIVVGMFRNPFNLDQPYVPQTKTQNYYVMVMDSPNIVMEILPDGNNSYVSTWVGANATYTVTAAQAAPLNISTTVLNTTTPAATIGFPLKILGVAQRPNIATGLYVPLLVAWNSHELMSTGTTGAA